MKPRLFILGSANIDLTFHLAKMPPPGVTEICPLYHQGFGGKGANQAVMAALMGTEVTFLGKVGEDAFGSAIAEHMTRLGIRTTFITSAPGQQTGTAVILVDADGQNTIITHAGPNVTLTRADVDAAAGAIQSADTLLATLEVPAEALGHALQLARDAGKRVILNPAPPVDFPHELLQSVDICIPNESELQAITGLPVDSIEAVARATEALARLGPTTVIVTLGERGVFWRDPQQTEFLPARSVKAIDTSGAGDAFCGAFAVYFSEGLSSREAARKACDVATLSVTRLGTQASYPRRELLENDEFLSEAFGRH